MVDSRTIFDCSKRLDDKGETGFHVSITGSMAKREEIIRDVISMLQAKLPVQGDCPRAPAPFRYCPDCDGSFACQMPGRTPQ